MERAWKILYGDFKTNGVSLRRLTSSAARNWTSAMEAGAIHLFMNLSGTSLVFGTTARLPMVSKTIGVAHIGSLDGIIASCTADTEANDILILCVTPEWVNRNFGSKKQSLHANLVQLLDKKTQHSVLLNKVRAMSYLEFELCSSLSAPPVHKDARPFWYLAKIIELLSIHLFKPPTLGPSETFCSSHKRLSKQRVDKVLIWLEENLDEPLDLAALAESIHCSSSYLSRVFSESMGTTITKKLRAMRVEKAADLLRSGDFNVTEAAIEVGYNSVSHFTKAFQEEKGMKPSEFLRLIE